MSNLVDHLRNGQQCDEEGIMCIVSRQACHEAADRIQALEAEVERLVEDRARFPDRPDWVGNMIGAHYGNLKSQIDSANRFCDSYRMKANASEREVQRLRGVLEEIVTWGNSNHCTKLRSIARAALKEGA